MGAVTLGGGFVLAWQWQATRQLRDEITLRREAQGALDRQRKEYEQLSQQRTAQAELDRLRADRAALLRLRTEIDTLTAGVAKKLAASAAKQAAPTSNLGIELTSATDWKNVGRASPAAMLETALWAAVGGDIDALAETLCLDGPARSKAEEILAQLPENVRQQYPTPETLVALFTAKDMPTDAKMNLAGQNKLSESDAAKISGAGQFKLTEGDLVLSVLFVAETMVPGAESAKRRNVQPRTLFARREGDSWKLVVPVQAVEKYAALLAGATVPATRVK